MRGLYGFGPFRLDPERRLLTRAGEVVPLAPKAFDLLRLLVGSEGRALSRKELLDTLWPDTVVEEASLSFQVSALRKVLGPESKDWIETLPRHGYRFAAPVTVLASDVAPPAPSAPAPGIPAADDRRKRASVAVAGAAVVLALSFVAGWAWRYARPTPKVPSGPSSAVPLTSYPGLQLHPTLSPDGSQVAFAWDGPSQDNDDVYVKLVGPGEPVRLTTDPARDRSPAWSPDGRSIAFLRFTSETRAGAFVIPALGGAERKLADVSVVVTLHLEPAGPSERNLSWSPDGRWIAVAGGLVEGQPPGIWLVPIDGGSPRRLTGFAGNGLGDVGPSFSPSGRSLAFVRLHDYALADVLVLPLAADLAPEGEPVRLTCESRSYGAPAWTPDGRGVVFASGTALGIPRLQRIEVESASAGHCGEAQLLSFGELATSVSISRTGRLVYEREIRDTDIWRLELPRPGSATAEPVRLVASTFDDHTPDSSPDGTRLAFASTRSGTEEIWVAGADGSNPAQLTRMGGAQTANPRWSPDGRTVLFDSRRGGSADLYLIEPGTGSLRQLTGDPAYEGEASWSRDGRWVYFGSNRTGRYEVWKIPAAGGDWVPITRSGGMTPREAPDGKWLYYAKGLATPTAIWKVPTSGGEESPVVDDLSYPSNFVVAGEGIYFLAQRGGPDGTSIDLFAFGTGKTRSILRTRSPWWYGLTMSPDQRAILYSAVEHSGSNLMLVEGFR